MFLILFLLDKISPNNILVILEQIRSAGYHDKVVPFEVIDYENDFHKLTQLEVFLLDSKIPITSETTDETMLVYSMTTEISTMGDDQLNVHEKQEDHFQDDHMLPDTKPLTSISCRCQFVNVMLLCLLAGLVQIYDR